MICFNWRSVYGVTDHSQICHHQRLSLIIWSFPNIQNQNVLMIIIYSKENQCVPMCMCYTYRLKIDNYLLSIKLGDIVLIYYVSSTYRLMWKLLTRVTCNLPVGISMALAMKKSQYSSSWKIQSRGLAYYYQDLCYSGVLRMPIFGWNVILMSLQWLLI